MGSMMSPIMSMGQQGASMGSQVSQFSNPQAAPQNANSLMSMLSGGQNKPTNLPGGSGNPMSGMMGK